MLSESSRETKLIIKFIDSYRIFPVSLQKLCEVFNYSKGKTTNYKAEFNNINIFENKILFDEFIKYSINDSLILYKCMLAAGVKYKEAYSIDLSDTLSTSSLSLIIFRSKFLTKLNVDIPVLNSQMDGFIRYSYYGGSTDYYKAYAENVFYYDVNSLYPFSMLKDMPFEPGDFIKDLSQYDLNNFFGFALAEITCPDDIKIPVLPFKDADRTIHPTGTWTGTYFSEELKAVSKYGYTVKLISGYPFSQIKLFKDYVEYFFEIKQNSINEAERFIAKMHLNQLYGIFGRKKETIETLSIYKKDLPKYIATKIIKAVIEVSDDVLLFSYTHSTI